MPHGFHEIRNTREGLYAFRITDSLDGEGLDELVERLNEVFDVSETKVDLLLIYDVENSANLPFAAIDLAAIKTDLRSVANLRRYVLVGAPTALAALTEAVGKLIPMKAETFDDPAIAWKHLDARPL